MVSPSKLPDESKGGEYIIYFVFLVGTFTSSVLLSSSHLIIALNWSSLEILAFLGSFSCWLPIISAINSCPLLPLWCKFQLYVSPVVTKKFWNKLAFSLAFISANWFPSGSVESIIFAEVKLRCSLVLLWILATSIWFDMEVVFQDTTFSEETNE